MQTIYECQHGQFLSQADAWFAHEHNIPSLQPNSTQAVTLEAKIVYESPTQPEPIERTITELVSDAANEILAPSNLPNPSEYAQRIATRFSELLQEFDS